MIHRLQVAIIIILVPLLGLYWYANEHDIALRDFLFPGPLVLRIANVPIQVEIADTQAEHIRGLSGRTEIGAQGLLFIFDESDYYRIWMKDMLFPIDIIWIDEDLTVVGITREVSPSSYPEEVFEPPVPVRYLVETEAHFAEIFDIAVGDSVELPQKYR